MTGNAWMGLPSWYHHISEFGPPSRQMIEMEAAAALDRILEQRRRETRRGVFWGRVIFWSLCVAGALAVVGVAGTIEYLLGVWHEPI